MYDIKNYYERAVALLAGQFQDNASVGEKTNLQKLIAALTASAQNLQSQLFDLNTQRSLFTAVGQQLDGIGQIVGLARLPGQPDESAVIDGKYYQGYREAIEFQIFINQSSGTPEQVIAACEFLTRATTVLYVDTFPAGYCLSTDGLNLPLQPWDLNTAIQNLSPAGVEFNVLIVTKWPDSDPDDIPFAFASDVVTSPFYVSPNNQLETNTTDFLYAQSAGVSVLGGFFAEFGYPIDTEGAGTFSEGIVIDGNLAPIY